MSSDAANVARSINKKTAQDWRVIDRGSRFTSSPKNVENVLAEVNDKIIASSGGSVEFTANCDSLLTVGTWVCVDIVAGTVVEANAIDLETVAAGIVSTKPTSTTATVVVSGLVGGFTGLTPRDVLFLSNIPGQALVNPVYPGDFGGYRAVQRLGVALTSSSVIVNVAAPIELE